MLQDAGYIYALGISNQSASWGRRSVSDARTHIRQTHTPTCARTNTEPPPTRTNTQRYTCQDERTTHSVAFREVIPASRVDVGEPLEAQYTLGADPCHRSAGDIARPACILLRAPPPLPQNMPLPDREPSCLASPGRQPAVISPSEVIRRSGRESGAAGYLHAFTSAATISSCLDASPRAKTRLRHKSVASRGAE